MLEDEIIPVVEESDVISAVTTPDADPITTAFVNADEPVVLPAEEVAVYEDTVARSVLEDEIIPVVEESVVVSSVVLPEADPVRGIFAEPGVPSDLTAEDASIYEDTVRRSVLEDQIIPDPEVVVHVAETAKPYADPVANLMVNPNEPVEIPAEEAAVYEDTVSASVLEDEHFDYSTIEVRELVTHVELPEVDLVNVAEDPAEDAGEFSVYMNSGSTVLEDEGEEDSDEAYLTVTEEIAYEAQPLRDILGDETIEVYNVKDNPELFDVLNRTVLEDEVEVLADQLEEIPEEVLPANDPIAFLGPEEPEALPGEEYAVFEDKVARTVLEDTYEIMDSSPTPSYDTVLTVDDTFDPNTMPENYVLSPDVVTSVFEETAAPVVLEDEASPVVEETVVVASPVLPTIDPVTNAFIDQNDTVVLTSEDGTAVFEENVTPVVLEDAERSVHVSETLLDESGSTNIFDIADAAGYITKYEEEAQTIKDLEYVELVSVNERENSGEVVKEVTTTIVEDNEVVLEVTETHRRQKFVDTAVKCTTYETTEEEKQEGPAVPTIPTDENGNVKHEDAVVPTLPPINAKGVGPGALEAPYVLPATKEGMESMAQYPDTIPDEKTDDEGSLGERKNIPVAPIIDRDGNVIYGEEPTSQSADPKSNVIMANADVEITYNEQTEDPILPDVKPEVSDQSAEEPAEGLTEESAESSPEDHAENTSEDFDEKSLDESESTEESEKNSDSEEKDQPESAEESENEEETSDESEKDTTEE